MTIAYRPRPLREFRWDLVRQPNLPRAACRDFPDLEWVPDLGRNGPQLDRLRAICAGCPELEPCREFAMQSWRIVGMWGGTTYGERKAMRGGR